MKQIARQIHEHLKTADKILIVPHQNPDGDALGSTSALTEYARALGADVRLFCATTAHAKYDFLNHIDKMTTDPAVFQDVELDYIIVLDSGDTRYAGIHKFIENCDAEIVNIDHHPTNNYYGYINLVIPGASSTAEVIYYFFKHNNIRITREVATALLTGLVTDTDNFTNPATSTTALKMAADLLRLGGNLKLIHKRLMKNKSLGALKIWGTLLSRLEKNEEQGIVYTYIKQADLEAIGVTDSEADGVANFLNNMDEARITLILRELGDGNVKGSFRTTKNDIDVSAMAKKLGGGGHKKAAGFTTEGTIEAVLKQILTK